MSRKDPADVDHKVVFLETDVAEEVLDLVDDRPGDADEALLDDAIEAIETANGGLPGPAQQAVASGEAVAVGLAPDEADALHALIETNTETDRNTLRSIGRALKSKLRSAAKKVRSTRKQ